MTRLMFVPIEPLEERYSLQWIKWFKEEFKKRETSYFLIGDQKKKKIKKGQFLDIYDTNIYKLEQLKSILYLLKKGFEGTIFFMDLWFPGIEMIAYIRDCDNRRIRIEGIMHAGTYDPYDFLTQSGCNEWGEDLEKSWLRIFDKIYVATNFHKELIETNRGNYKNIEVVKFPCYQGTKKEKNIEKKNQVVFPHRLSIEKQPFVFKRIEEMYKDRYPNDEVEFVVTKERCRNKKEYYKCLAESKVSFSSALQETFGIAMLESFNLGCIPVVPDRLSYQEIFNSCFRYASLEEAVEMIYNGIHFHTRFSQTRYIESVEDIVRRIRII